MLQSDRVPIHKSTFTSNGFLLFHFSNPLANQIVQASPNQNGQSVKWYICLINMDEMAGHDFQS